MGPSSGSEHHTDQDRSLPKEPIDAPPDLSAHSLPPLSPQPTPHAKSETNDRRESSPLRPPRKARALNDSGAQSPPSEDVTRELNVSTIIEETVRQRSRWEDYKRSTIEMLRISPATWGTRIGLTALSAAGLSTFTYCMSQGVVALGDATALMNAGTVALNTDPSEIMAPLGRALGWLFGGAFAFQTARLFGSVNETVSDAHTLEVDLKIERSLGKATESFLEETRQREDLSEVLTLAEDHQASSKELVNGIVQLSQEFVELGMSVGVLLWSGAGPTVIPIALGGYLTYRCSRRCSQREVAAEQEVNKLYQLYEDGHRAVTNNTSISNLQQMHAYGRVFDHVIDIKANAETLRNQARLANRRDDILVETMLWAPVLGAAAVASAYFWQGAYDGATLMWVWMTLYPLQDKISSIGALLSEQATDLELASSRHALADLSETLGDKRERITLSSAAGVTFDKARLRRRGATRDTLKPTTFSISPGMSVAIVGNNGQGKSSLLGLISGRILPSSGDVHIGPHNTREKNVLVGNLSQDFTLVPGRSVRENIELHKTGPSGLSADEVIDQLGIREILFDNKPDGLDTIIPGINQKGTNFSGGQRQLIALAQAIASEPGLLVLDEPLSALGPSMQAHINSVLLNLEKRPTIFFVTHKYEQANSCDWILVIEKGEVVEQGPPAELLRKRQGTYKSLYLQQRKLSAKRTAPTRSSNPAREGSPGTTESTTPPRDGPLSAEGGNAE